MSSSSSSNSGRVIKLQSSDGRIFDVEEDVPVQSETIKCLILESSDPGVILVKNVDSETWERVIDWCKKTIEHRQAQEQNTQWKPNWKDEFYKIDLTAFYDLLRAANYLEVTDLLDETCDRVARFISKKTPDEVRRIFDIENDFAREEEEEIKMARAWACKISHQYWSGY